MRATSWTCNWQGLLERIITFGPCEVKDQNFAEGAYEQSFLSRVFCCSAFSFTTPPYDKSHDLSPVFLYNPIRSLLFALNHPLSTPNLSFNLLPCLWRGSRDDNVCRSVSPESGHHTGHHDNFWIDWDNILCRHSWCQHSRVKDHLECASMAGLVGVRRKRYFLKISTLSLRAC